MKKSKELTKRKKKEEVRLAKIETANVALSKAAKDEIDPADAGISDTSREMDEDVEK